MRIPIRYIIRYTLLLLTVWTLASVPAYAQATAEAATEVTTETPDAYHLTPAYPNPFNPQTQVTLTLTEAQHVTVEVYNLLGRRVAELHDGRLAADQPHTFVFEASNAPSGIYLIRVTGEAFTTTQRVTLLK